MDEILAPLPCPVVVVCVGAWDCGGSDVTWPRPGLAGGVAACAWPALLAWLDETAGAWAQAGRPWLARAQASRELLEPEAAAGSPVSPRARPRASPRALACR